MVKNDEKEMITAGESARNYPYSWHMWPQITGPMQIGAVGPGVWCWCAKARLQAVVAIENI